MNGFEKIFPRFFEGENSNPNYKFRDHSPAEGTTIDVFRGSPLAQNVNGVMVR